MGWQQVGSQGGYPPQGLEDLAHVECNLGVKPPIVEVVPTHSGGWCRAKAHVQWCKILTLRYIDDSFLDLNFYFYLFGICMVYTWHQHKYKEPKGRPKIDIKMNKK